MQNRVQEDQFRATDKWATLITSFREGIKQKRKRRFFRTFHECFSESEAIHWLRIYVENHQQPTKQVLTYLQIVQLLKILVQSGLLVRVWTKNKYGLIDIQSNLYKFSIVDDVCSLVHSLFCAFVLNSPKL